MKNGDLTIQYALLTFRLITIHFHKKYDRIKNISFQIWLLQKNDIPLTLIYPT